MSTKKLKVHFIGIGGIGVSALAKYYLENGHKISGSDLTSSEITETLEKQGAKVIIGKHTESNIKTKNLPDLVVYSPAVQSDNPELKAARKKGIKCLSYPQALGELTKQHFTIAVSGTHGKSTTTAMIGLLLVKAGLDPTVIIGTKLKEFGDSNCRVGKSKYLVIEADEHFASFLNYWPKIIVITNIEKDHLDYYKNIKNIKKTFKEFISHLPKDGILIQNSKFKIQNYNSKFKIINYDQQLAKKEKLKKILKIPGEHNIFNALAALAVAKVLEIPDKISFKVLSKYRGSWRRFEEKNLKIKNLKLKIVNDYGHHPTEIRVTLKAAREKWPKKKIWCIYQPHQYQRTYYLFKEFVKVFQRVPVDKLIITDIYDVAGREEKKIKEKISAKKIVQAISNSSTIYLPKEKIIDYLKENLKGGEIVIIMGAGDIYNLSLQLTKEQ